MGVTPKTLRSWREKGCPFQRASNGRDLRWDIEAVAAWRDINDTTGRRKKIDQKDELRAARIRKEKALAAKHELDVAEAEGRLVDREKVQASYLDRVYAIRGQLLGLASRYASRWSGISDARELHKEIDAAVRDVLAELSKVRGVYDSDDVAKAVEEAGGVKPFLEALNE